MRVSIDKDMLRRVTAAAARAVPSKAPDRPILSCVHLQARGKTLTATGTDTATTCRASAKALVSEEGEAAVAASVLVPLAAQLPEGDAFLSFEEPGLRIEAGQGSWLLASAPVDTYPVIKSPEGTRVEIDAAALGTGLAEVLKFASDAIGRPALRGVLLEADPEGLRLVALDGFWAAVKLLRGVTVLAEDETVLPAAKDLALLPPMLEGAEKLVAVFSERSVSFAAEADGVKVETVSTLIAKDYPDWRKLARIGEGGNRLTVGCAEMLAAVKRCALLGGGARALVLEADPETGAAVSLVHADVGEGAEAVGGEFEGEPCRIGYWPEKLAAVLETIGGEVAEIRQISPRAPTLVASPDDPDLLIVLMPVVLPASETGEDADGGAES